MGILDRFLKRPADGVAHAHDAGPAASSDHGSLPPIPDQLRALGVRTAWLPRTSPGEGPAEGSRMGGRPFLLAGEAWPACPRCNKPLFLVVQLRSTELPEEVAARTGPGLFQSLYCLSECESEGDGWEAYSPVHLNRRLDLDAPGGLREGGRALPAHAVASWTAAPDLPHYEDIPDGLPESLDAAYDRTERPIDGDKLGGWPKWVQGAEYPACTRCGRQLELLFQVDSEHHLAYMWGDAGCAHLTFCPDHPDVLAFAWACC